MRGRVRGCPSTLRHVPRGRNRGDARRRTGPQDHRPATAPPPDPVAPTAHRPTERHRPGHNGNRGHRRRHHSGHQGHSDRRSHDATPARADHRQAHPAETSRPAADHPAGVHPAGVHPAADHPAGDQPGADSRTTPNHPPRHPSLIRATVLRPPGAPLPGVGPSGPIWDPSRSSTW